MVDVLDIGSKIEDNVRESMPSKNQIEQEVQRILEDEVDRNPRGFLFFPKWGIMGYTISNLTRKGNRNR